MDSYQDLIDAHDNREAAALKRKREDRQQYEKAARQAHKVRNAARLVLSLPEIPWEELGLSSQRHLIADAENVAADPSITVTELARLYRERLVAAGDSDNPDLEGEDEVVEAMVLDDLKDCLAGIARTKQDPEAAE